MSKQLLVRLECDYCNAHLLIPAQPPGSAAPKEIEGWTELAVYNETHLYCCPEHAQQALKLLRNSHSPIAIAEPGSDGD